MATAATFALPTAFPHTASGERKPWEKELAVALLNGRVDKSPHWEGRQISLLTHAARANATVTQKTVCTSLNLSRFMGM